MRWYESGSTDLPRQSFRDSIVVVMPKDSDGLLKPLACSREVDFNRIRERVMDFDHMSHVGVLEFDRQDGAPLSLTKCGGNLEFSPIPEDSAFYWLRREWTSGYYLTCSKCGLKLTTSRYDWKSFRNVMFHLMLKQMNPLLRFCNFVDCSTREPNDVVHGEALQAIQSLGVVAVDCCLWGLLGGASAVGNYGLGFILKPNIRSRTEGPGELGKWLQYLSVWKYELMVRAYMGNAPELFGPKPR